MKVEIRTKIEQAKPVVSVVANEVLSHPDHFEDRIAALRAAQKWLRNELKRTEKK